MMRRRPPHRDSVSGSRQTRCEKRFARDGLEMSNAINVPATVHGVVFDLHFPPRNQSRFTMTAPFVPQIALYRNWLAARRGLTFASYEDMRQWSVRDLDALMQAVHTRAEEYRRTPMIGRTHGVHAEPMTFGLKLALWYAEMERNQERLRRARETVNVGKISGAVGTIARSHGWAG